MLSGDLLPSAAPGPPPLTPVPQNAKNGRPNIASKNVDKDVDGDKEDFLEQPAFG